MALERLELDTAVAQGGVLTGSQLLEGGRTQKWIERETSAGRLIPLKNGVYRALDLRDHTDLLRAALVTLPNAVVSHESAAHLLRFPHLPALRPTVTVHSRTTHLFPGVTVRRTTDLESDHAIRVDGLKTTHTLRTCFDLAGVLDDATFEEVVEALAMADRLVVDDLVAFAASLRRRGKPGSSAIDRLVERRAGIDASKLERLGLRVLAAGGDPLTGAPVSGTLGRSGENRCGLAQRPGRSRVGLEGVAHGGEPNGARSEERPPGGSRRLDDSPLHVGRPE